MAGVAAAEAIRCCEPVHDEDDTEDEPEKDDDIDAEHEGTLKAKAWFRVGAAMTGDRRRSGATARVGAVTRRRAGGGDTMLRAETIGDLVLCRRATTGEGGKLSRASEPEEPDFMVTATGEGERRDAAVRFEFVGRSAEEDRGDGPFRASWALLLNEGDFRGTGVRESTAMVAGLAGVTGETAGEVSEDVWARGRGGTMTGRERGEGDGDRERRNAGERERRDSEDCWVKNAALRWHWEPQLVRLGLTVTAGETAETGDWIEDCRGSNSGLPVRWWCVVDGASVAREAAAGVVRPGLVELMPP